MPCFMLISKGRLRNAPTSEPMTEILLIRHATNSYVSTGRLAGWTPGVTLNEDGKAEAEALAKGLRARASPRFTPARSNVRCKRRRRWRRAVLPDRPAARWGRRSVTEWQGAASRLRRKLWPLYKRIPAVQPSAARRSVRPSCAVTRWNTLPGSTRAGARGFSHSDIIKLVIAYYLGAHIDLFQRIEISPTSISIIVLGSGRPQIVCVNDTSHLPRREAPPARPAGRWSRLRKWLTLS